jgi:dolichol kinase
VPDQAAGGPLDSLKSPSFLAEARRKAIHLGSILIPLGLLYEWLPWPRGRHQFALFFLVLLVGAIAIDLLRIHQLRVRSFFRGFFGEMIREHEQLGLLGSTYLLLASLLAVEIFPQPIAAAAIGFTVLGDAFAAIVGRAFGRHRLFRKSVEGALGGFVACLVWASFLSAAGFVPWTTTLAGAAVASLVELLPIPLDDNLGMTLASGYAMKLLSGAGA